MNRSSFVAALGATLAAVSAAPAASFAAPVVQPELALYENGAQWFLARSPEHARSLFLAWWSEREAKISRHYANHATPETPPEWYTQFVPTQEIDHERYAATDETVLVPAQGIEMYQEDCEDKNCGIDEECGKHTYYMTLDDIREQVGANGGYFCSEYQG